jgi:hypothetical protein
MKFYCIVENNNDNSNNRCKMFEKSCAEKNIKFIKILPDSFNYLDKIDSNDLVYRATDGEQAKQIEQFILDRNVRSFYIDKNYSYTELLSFLLYKHNHLLPLIKIIPNFTININNLNQYVDYLGGFPLVLKVQGGSCGIGVMKIDSMQSLISITDFFKNKGISAVLMQFIKYNKQGRLVVLGNKVVASHLNHCGEDFRSNVGDISKINRDSIIFPEKIQNIAVKSVKLMGIEFGGVDILFDEKTETPYVSEVNFPCNFPTTQKCTGIDIASKMLDYLMNKKAS